MQNNGAGINELLDAIKKMQRVTEVLTQETLAKTMIDMQEVGDCLEKAAAQLEQEQNNEMLKVFVYDVLPKYEALSQACEQVCEVVKSLTEDQTLSQLKMQKKKVYGFMPDSVVHLVADITSNAGDYILGKSLKMLVENGTPITWKTVHIVRPVTEDVVELCNRSKGIVLGGGGLFLKDTNPNQISGWTWPCSLEALQQIEKPIYVMGVGYNRFRGQEEFDPIFTESVNALVEKSAFVGLRNHGSIRAVRSYLREDLRDKVKFHPCATTVLSKLYKLPKREGTEPFIAINCAYDRMHMRYGEHVNEVMMAIARVAKKLSADYRIKCYIHCEADAQFNQFLDRMAVPYEDVMLMKEMSSDEYLKYFTEPELVLAIRGHAQMIPFGCITPTISMISHDKLAWFLEDIGHPEWGIEVLDEDFENKLMELSKYMLANREKICEEIQIAQDKLWDIMQENLKEIKL